MSGEAQILLWIHGWADPWLDAFFLVSHQLGRMPVLVGVAVAVITWHALARRWRRAGTWLALGLLTFVLVDGTKAAVARPRPGLWPRLVAQGGHSFPSGHALGSAALFTLLAYEAAQRRPRSRAALFAAAACGSLWLGAGRLYLGVHWPSDVLAGWAMGAAVAWLGIALMRRSDGPAASAGARV